jgi:hypothetical protein
MAPVAALPMAFGEELSRLSSTYVALASIPASRRRYCPGLPTDMADMSIRFMNAGHDRLVHTIEVTRGLSKVQGKFLRFYFLKGTSNGEKFQWCRRIW